MPYSTLTTNMLFLRGVLVSLLLTFITSTVYASPVLYAKEMMHILSKPAAEAFGEEETALNAPSVETRHTFLVSIRPHRSVQTDWFMDMQGQQDGHGMLITLDGSDDITMAPINQHAPLDVLLVQPTGKIMAILPSLMLAEMPEDLELSGNIHSVLYLKAGAVQARGIQPGNRLEHRLFKAAPLILQ